MKHTPLEEARHIGCNCCNNVGRKLNKNKWLDVGFGEVVFTILNSRGRSLIRTYIGGLSESEDQVTQVKDLKEEYGSKFGNAECITLWFNAPLHDELYEYNKEDGEWYLVSQGKGFA